MILVSVEFILNNRLTVFFLPLGFFGGVAKDIALASFPVQQYSKRDHRMLQQQSTYLFRICSDNGAGII